MDSRHHMILMATSLPASPTSEPCDMLADTTTANRLLRSEKNTGYCFSGGGEARADIDITRQSYRDVKSGDRRRRLRGNRNSEPIPKVIEYQKAMQSSVKASHRINWSKVSRSHSFVNAMKPGDGGYGRFTNVVWDGCLTWKMQIN
ncbi:hypothetical protein PHLCEN_2v3180 [Hermanssonia centrifuga]|uniref:Uncharacterized protein n=1 Tax=Hermanssonia centrifuga TaxID=98765 RepID=A0A2R6R0X2_9APHY|nr:hypothetical protein PHLCEN_2v3180 [Hermanssonia centrifuga]